MTSRRERKMDTSGFYSAENRLYGSKGNASAPKTPDTTTVASSPTKKVRLPLKKGGCAKKTGVKREKHSLGMMAGAALLPSLGKLANPVMGGLGEGLGKSIKGLFHKHHNHKRKDAQKMAMRQQALDNQTAMIQNMGRQGSGFTGGEGNTTRGFTGGEGNTTRQMNEILPGPQMRQQPATGYQRRRSGFPSHPDSMRMRQQRNPYFSSEGPEMPQSSYERHMSRPGIYRKKGGSVRSSSAMRGRHAMGGAAKERKYKK